MLAGKGVSNRSLIGSWSVAESTTFEKIFGVYFLLCKLRKYWCLSGNVGELTLNCGWKAFSFCPGCQKSLLLRNEVLYFVFKEQLSEISLTISDEVIFKLMLSNKKVTCGQTSPSFVVPVRKVRAVSLLFTAAPLLMVGLIGSAGSQPILIEWGQLPKTDHLLGGTTGGNQLGSRLSVVECCWAIGGSLTSLRSGGKSCVCPWLH